MHSKMKNRSKKPHLGTVVIENAEIQYLEKDFFSLET